ncbi:hypothetical protein JTE90_019885 [Oedothorax gibbosus]|uniref:Uncharacterized protein n=1 Tax=Oedothorax gibbosus TaxID=931172 RepID=A0AAV6VYN9_9ARAC|nr:hypothetical protein JTE90_019885 [Oedothorax gibbosus]
MFRKTIVQENRLLILRSIAFLDYSVTGLALPSHPSLGQSSMESVGKDQEAYRLGSNGCLESFQWAP